jgi:hypothetical protein
MASDSFTNTNGVALASHAAGGNTWSGCGQSDASGEIIDGTAAADLSDYFSVSARATNSSSDYSQIVFKAGDYGNESKNVHVRASGTNRGYWVQVYEVTGDNITTLLLRKDEGFLTSCVVSISRLVDHTFAIKATTVAGGVELRGYVDGSLLTWGDTSSEDETDSQVFTDLNANTPIASGNPGFSCYFFDDISSTNSAFDDWTDTEPTSSTTVNPSVGLVTVQGLSPSGNDFTNVRYQEVLINGAGSPMSNLTDLHFTVWYGGQCSGAPDLSYSDLTTGSAGTASYSLATGSLVFGQKVFGVITDGGASLSSYTCGLLTLNYS